MKKSRFASKIFFTVLMGAIGIVFLLPLIWMASSSLKYPLDIMRFPIQWIPGDPQWSNYTYVFTRKLYPIGHIYLNSLLVAFGTILGAVIISVTSGYAFAKMRFRGKNFIFMVYLATMMIPVQVTLIPRFYMLRQFGFYDNLLALVLPGCFYAIGILMMRQFFMTIPMEMTESGKIDGAGMFAIFLRLHLPLIRSPLAALSVLVFVTSWNEFLNPLIFINSPENFTIPLFLNALMEAAVGVGYEYHYAMAAGVVGTLPLVVAFIFLQHFFVESIATSGLKN